MSFRDPETRSRVARSVLGLSVLLLALAPLTVWRLHLEKSLWIDETYSLLLTTYPVNEIVTITGADAHPPGYYLALKAWLKAARAVGFEPGVLWARLLNGTLWAGLAVGTWLWGRRLLGRRTGTLLAWVVAGGASAALVARDLRGYGVATAFLFGAYLALVEISSDRGESSAARTRLWYLWAIYALCATLALWAHLLSAMVLAALGLVWLGLMVVARRLDRSTLLPALVGNALPIGLFSPWLVRVGRQVAYLEQSDPQWMTPPSLANLGRVFSFWYPFSRIGDPEGAQGTILLLLGLATVLLPLALGVGWLVGAARKGPEGGGPNGDPRTLASATALGLGGSAVYVVVIWLLDRLDLAHTFHGPRYPVLAVHLWIAGLVCWTAWAAGRRGVRMRWVVIAFVPWLLAAVVGEVRMARAEAWGALSELETMAGDSWPVAGEVVYVMPPELMPFYQESLGSFEVRRIERLPCDAADAGSVSVLDVNLWHGLDRPRDHLMRAMLRGGRLGREVERFAFPPEQPALVLYRVAKLDGELLGALCRRGLQPPLRSEMTGSVSEALPEDQRSQSEWSYLEVSPDLELYRWSTAARALVRFDRDVGPGEYVLHLVGYRTDAPRPDAPVAVELPEVGLQWQKVVPAGRFHLCLPISWPGGGDPPALNVEYPVWSTGDIEAGGRTLGFLFYGAWLTPVSGEVVGREGDPCASPRSPDS